MKRMSVQRMMLIAAAIVAYIPLTSQTIVPIRVNTDSLPRISARLYALDNAGMPQGLGAQDVQVTENGAAQNATTTSEPSSSGRNLSLVVAIDGSLSMGSMTNNPTNIDLAKNAARGIVQLLTSTADEIALTQIASNARLIYGLSTNKSGYSSSVDAFSVRGGMNLVKGLNDLPFGALTHLQNARNARALLLITDGTDRADASGMVATARTFGVSIYVLCLRSKITPELRMLADSTGGAWGDNIQSVADAQAYARAFVADAKRLPSCSVEWTTSDRCSQSRYITISRNSVTRSMVTSVKKTKIVYLDASLSGIEYGSIQPGTTSSKTITLTAMNGDIVISGIAIANAAFRIDGSISFPVTVQKGSAFTVSVEYAPSSDNGTYGTVNINNTSCSSPVVYLHGGSAKNGSTLHLDSPNGGETFTAGIDTIITWSNALPDDFVRIEQSFDNGNTWSSITENAQGLKYAWTPGPKSSSQVIMRVSRTVIDPKDIIVMRGQDQPVYSAIFTEDGKHVVTGGHDGSVRIWSPFDGSQEKIVGLHGNWVWSLAQKPGTTLVASASHDGSVRIWDYSSGQRVATIPAEGRVWSVAFNKDGSKLLAGTDRGVSEISTATWTILSSKIVDQGPVYDIAVSKDGSKIALAEGPQATLRDLNYRVLQTFKPAGGGKYLQYTVAISPDASEVMSGGANLSASIYDATTGDVLRSTPIMKGGVLSVSFSPDGSSVLVAGGDGTAKTFVANSLKLQTSLTGHNGILYAAGYSPDGKQVVTGATDFTARVWSLDRIGTTTDLSDGKFSILSGTSQTLNVAMGDVMVGEAVDAIKTIISNSSSDPLVVKSVTMIPDSGDASDFNILGLIEQTIINSGNPFTIDVAFSPTAVGLRKAYAQVVMGTQQYTLELTGNGTQDLLSYPNVIDYGRRVANQSVVDSVITIRANGSLSGPVQISMMSITGDQGAQYSIVNGGGSVSIQPGQSHKVTVRFDPTNYGRFAASLDLRLANGSTVSIGLYGEATGDGRIATSINNLLFPTGTCKYAVAQLPFDLRNSGNTDLQVYSIGVEGSNADEFTVSSADTYPLTIGPNSSKSFVVTFNPNRIGVKDARVVVSSSAINASNGRTTVNISARKDSVGFELSRTDLDFGNVAENTVVSERILLLNTGTISLKWPRNSVTVGRFQIDSINPDITGGGKRSDMTIRFLGGRAGDRYDTSYDFIDTICGRRQTIRLRATVKSYIGATIEVDTVFSQTGQLVSVPVMVKNITNFDRTSVRSITGHFSVNGTLLTPTGNVSDSKINGEGTRSFSANIPIPSSEGVATTLTFLTTWGNDTSSFIRIDSLTYSDTLTFRTVQGCVILSDLCKQGGTPRLVKLATQSAGITVGPNPAGDRTDLRVSLSEPGITSVRLFSSSGGFISSIVHAHMRPGVWEFDLDTSQLPNGAYFITLTTPTETLTRRVEVVR